MSRVGGSSALAAMLKARSDNGMVVLNESNVEKAPAIVAKPASITTQKAPTKCYVCAKSVFKMEEVIAVGHAWHGACFTCGGTNDDGCKRKLVRDGFVENKGQPYCKSCYDKKFKIGANKSESAAANLIKNRPLSIMLSSRQKKSGDEAPPEVPAYVLASQRAAQEVNSHVGAVMSSDFLEPAIYGRDPPKPEAPVVPVGGRSATRSSVIVVETPKCGACAKSVYKMEEIIAIGKSWHSGCFCCGGTVGDGCKRKLVRDNFVEHKETPYCKPCYDKLFKSWVKEKKAANSTALEAMLVNKRSSARLIMKNFDLNAAAAAEGLPASTAALSIADKDTGDASPLHETVASRVLASQASAAEQNLFRKSTVPDTPVTVAPARKGSYLFGKTTFFSGANKCVRCAKTVYKMEEIIAVGQVWHNACFTCGGLNNDGCNKTLTRDKYVDHNQQPYCNACFSKHFRTKGYGHGGDLNTDYGEGKK